MNNSFNGFPRSTSLGGADPSASSLPLYAGIPLVEGVAGVDIKAGDGLIRTQTGEVYPMERIESACWTTGWANPNGGSGFPNKRRNQAIQDQENATVYYLSAFGLASSVPNGLSLFCAPIGQGNSGSVTVSSDAGAILSARLFFLSDGNLCIVWDTGAAKFNFAIYDKDLQPVVAATAIATLGESGYFDAIALSGGGFAVCYIGTGDAQKLAIYSNAGAVVSASATIKAWTGAANTKIGARLAQLSDGNIAVALTSAYATTKGLFYGVFSPAGAQVVAVALCYAPAGTQPEFNPEISVLNGFFAIATADTVNAKAYVYNNAGALQGAAYSNTNGTGAVLNSIKLLNDGTAFYLVSQKDLGGSLISLALARLPTNGVGYAAAQIGLTGLTSLKALDGFIKRDFLVAAQVGNMTVFRIPTFERVWQQALPFPATCDQPCLYPVGDFMMFTLVNNATTLTYGTLVRWLPYAIAGQAAANVLKGGAVPMRASVGVYKINPVKGGLVYKTMNFDYTANVINSPALSAFGGGFKGWVGVSTLTIRSLA